MALAEAPQPVAQIARRMGLARQSVQRIADDLAKAGLLHYAENPDHRRAKLVDLTAAGRAAYDQAMARHHPWAQGLAAGIDPAAIEAAAGLLREIGERLEARRAEPRHLLTPAARRAGFSTLSPTLPLAVLSTVPRPQPRSARRCFLRTLHPIAGTVALGAVALFLDRQPGRRAWPAIRRHLPRSSARSCGASWC